MQRRSGMRARHDVAAARTTPQASPPSARRLAQQRLREMQRQHALADAAAAGDQQRVRPARARGERRRRDSALPRRQGLRRSGSSRRRSRSSALAKTRDEFAARTARQRLRAVDDTDSAPARRAPARDTPRARARRIRLLALEFVQRATVARPLARRPRPARRTTTSGRAGSHPAQCVRARAIGRASNAVTAALIGVGRIGEAIAQHPGAVRRAAARSRARSARGAPRT